MLDLLALLAIGFLLTPTPTFGEQIKPTPFPTSATWTATLITTKKSDLCSQCLFHGRHSINTKKNLVHVRWFYGAKNDTTKRTYTNFADIVLGDRQTMYQVRGDNNSPATCVKIAPFPMNNFNESWSDGAVYQGDVWFQNRLCRKFTNVYPYVVQAKNIPSTYYENIFTGLPAGYENDMELLWYDQNDFDLKEPNDRIFNNVLLMNCTSPVQ
jgi:hypothetical protein